MQVELMWNLIMFWASRVRLGKLIGDDQQTLI